MNTVKIVVAALVIWYLWRRFRRVPTGQPQWRMVDSSRPGMLTNAGTAPSQQSIGKRLHNVWDGPRQIRGGAPVLRRDQPS